MGMVAAVPAVFLIATAGCGAIHTAELDDDRCEPRLGTFERLALSDGRPFYIEPAAFSRSARGDTLLLAGLPSYVWHPERGATTDSLLGTLRLPNGSLQPIAAPAGIGVDVHAGSHTGLRATAARAGGWWVLGPLQRAEARPSLARSMWLATIRNGNAALVDTLPQAAYALRPPFSSRLIEVADTLFWAGITESMPRRAILYSRVDEVWGYEFLPVMDPLYIDLHHDSSEGLILAAVVSGFGEPSGGQSLILASRRNDWTSHDLVHARSLGEGGTAYLHHPQFSEAGSDWTLTWQLDVRHENARYAAYAAVGTGLRLRDPALELAPWVAALGGGGVVSVGGNRPLWLMDIPRGGDRRTLRLRDPGTRRIADLGEYPFDGGFATATLGDTIFIAGPLGPWRGGADTTTAPVVTGLARLEVCPAG